MNNLDLIVAEQVNISNILLANFANSCADRGQMIGRKDLTPDDIREHQAAFEITGQQLGLFISKLIAENAELKQQVPTKFDTGDLPANNVDYTKIPEVA